MSTDLTEETALFEGWKREMVALSYSCKCGSGKTRHALEDARGIFCTYVCDDCEAGVKAQYRPEVFEDSAYACDEEIGEDY